MMASNAEQTLSHTQTPTHTKKKTFANVLQLKAPFSSKSPQTPSHIQGGPERMQQL